MTPSQLRALIEAATPAKWIAREREVWSSGGTSWSIDHRSAGDVVATGSLSGDNAALIAASPTLLTLFADFWEAVKARRTAAEALCEATDKGQDDSGKRDTPSYREWLTLDCIYTEAQEKEDAALAALEGVKP